MEEKLAAQIMERLDKLIRIIALSSTQSLTLTDRIRLLHRAGFRPSEIADILGTTSNVVNVRLSEMRRRGSER